MQPVQRDLLGECPCELTPISMVYTPQHIHDSKSVHSSMSTHVHWSSCSTYPCKMLYAPHPANPQSNAAREKKQNAIAKISPRSSVFERFSLFTPHDDARHTTRTRALLRYLR